jgi:hypothetical protein
LRARTAYQEIADHRRRKAVALDMCKLRGPFLQIHYSFLRLIATIEDVLEADQAVGPIRELTAA